jgi:hypothetical protein
MVAMGFRPVVNVSTAIIHSGFPIGAPTSYPLSFSLLLFYSLRLVVVERCISVKKLMERGVPRLEIICPSAAKR